MKYQLLHDILSGKRVLYAKKGAIVTLVADHGNVKIVATEKGDKFPVSDYKLRQI